MSERAGVGARAVRAWGLALVAVFSLCGVVVEAGGLPPKFPVIGCFGVRLLVGVLKDGAISSLPQDIIKYITIRNYRNNSKTCIAVVDLPFREVPVRHYSASGNSFCERPRGDYSKIFSEGREGICYSFQDREIFVPVKIAISYHQQRTADDAVCRGLPGVLDAQLDPQGLVQRKPFWQLCGNRNIGSNLRLPDLSGDAYRLLRGQSSRFGLLDRFPSGSGRAFGIGRGVLGGVQRSPQQLQASGSHRYRGDGSDEHQHSPKRHGLLGFQVAYFVLVGGLACGAALLGYQIADRGFDALDRGQKVRGGVQFWAGIFVCCGLSFAVIWGGLHLSFIWWFPWLL